MIKIAITTLILASISNSSSAQGVADALINSKAYNEAKALTTLNVNQLIPRYKDGLELSIFQNYSTGKKVTLTKIDTGRKDFEGNTIYRVKIIDNKTMDSVVLYPKLEWFPTEYYAVDFSVKGWKPDLGDGWYQLREIDRPTIYGKSSFALNLNQHKISKVLEEKIEYNRQDLLETASKKRFEAYVNYIDQCEAALTSKVYLTEIDLLFPSEFIYQGDNTKYDRIKVKVEKIRGTDGKIKELIFGVPFTDGSYPNKPEFQVRATLNSDGMFVIPTNDKKILSGILLPFDRNVLIGPSAVNTKSPFVMKGTLSMDIIGPSEMNWMVEYTKVERTNTFEYTQQWMLANITTTYDSADPRRLAYFIANIVYPHYVK